MHQRARSYEEEETLKVTVRLLYPLFTTTSLSAGTITELFVLLFTDSVILRSPNS